MKSVECLSEYERIIKSSSTSEHVFDDVLGWIQARREDWSDDRIRIGLVGDTSSGKSTLINAIIGKDILSSSVVPSSGVLVCCTYGSKEEIVVHFLNGSEQILKDDDFCTDKLQEYSDERYNVGNKKGVSSIELRSPNLGLGKDLIIIDSPGLNAYGLETHERITLDTLIPTIDICVYVTTVKVNSDSSTLSVLNAVAEYKCSIIIVQNKKDAINASPSGDKDKNQVAKDHIERIRRIIDRSDIKEKKNVPIIQVSAINALRWKTGRSGSVDDAFYSDTGFDSFICALKNEIAAHRPSIETTRMLSIGISIRELVNELTSSINSLEILDMKPDIRDYDSQINEIRSYAETAKKIANDLSDQITNDSGLFYDPSDLPINQNNVQYWFGLANIMINKSNASVSEYLRNTYENIDRFCRYVNYRNKW